MLMRINLMILESEGCMKKFLKLKKGENFSLAEKAKAGKDSGLKL